MGVTVGGRVGITINGRTYHPVADVEVEDSDIEVETVTNQDGTGGRTVKPKPRKIKIKYRQMDGLRPSDLMAATFDFSCKEKDTGITHLLTNAWHEGTPNKNTTNGEIDGLTVVSFQYQARGY